MHVKGRDEAVTLPQRKGFGLMSTQPPEKFLSRNSMLLGQGGVSLQWVTFAQGETTLGERSVLQKGS
jgi:hypothetical protein